MLAVEVDFNTRGEMNISDVALRSGLSTATLRYYERKGLVASIGRVGNRRQFDDAVLERLALISLGQAAGFSLDEIAGMFAPDGKPRIDREALSVKAAEIDKTITRLVAMRDGLLHAARCPARATWSAGPSGCCSALPRRAQVRATALRGRSGGPSRDVADLVTKRPDVSEKSRVPTSAHRCA